MVEEMEEMMRFRFEIYARLRGAIGICYLHIVTVEAPDAETAGAKLYDTHQDIHVVRVTVV